MTRRAIVTIVTRNYLHYACVLAESAERFHPECDFYICLADQPSSPWSPGSAYPQVIYGWDLGIPDWQRFCFQYTPFELSCALKPFAMRHLCEQGYDEVIYLDSDMQLYGSMTEVEKALQNHPLVLTPHLIKPFPDDGKQPGEELFLLAGTFNAGFLATRNDETGNRFLDWWSARLLRDGHKDMAASIFVDQKWLMLVPGLFPEVCILRNPGYNAGHWSLPQFGVDVDQSGQLMIGEHPLVLFHFSNLRPTDLRSFIREQNRLTLEGMPHLHKLVVDYHETVEAFDTYGASTWECAYDRLDDGTLIHPVWREAVRRQHPSLEGIENPFAVSQHPELIDTFTSVESLAGKWRKDWRVKPPKLRAPKRSKPYRKRRLKRLAEKIGLRRRAA